MVVYYILPPTVAFNSIIDLLLAVIAEFTDVAHIFQFYNRSSAYTEEYGVWVAVTDFQFYNRSSRRL